jgi:UPF0755 protein
VCDEGLCLSGGQRIALHEVAAAARIPVTSEHDAADISAESAEPARFFRRSVRLQSPHEALQPETPPPPPPHKRRPRLSALSGFLSFMLIGAVGIFFALIWAEHRLHEPGPLQSDKVVFTERGSVFDILTSLESEGVIDSAIFVNGALWAEGKRDSVKAGEYLFRANASIHDVIEILVSGKQILHPITIPEGLTSEQVVKRLRDSDFLIGDIIDMPKEGTLLPETYKVARGMLRSELIKKMQDDQKRVLDQIWARRAPDLPIHSPYELVTLASIVEKETGKADERPRVASVFYNRLQKHMRLQSDPTIVYGLVGGRGTLGRPITRAEVEKPTVYNTYTIEGLPPGPIANPGRAALEAVANPSRTQDLYFVADGTGGHTFAETYDQHQRNVQRWRQIEKDKDKPATDVDKVGPQALPGKDQKTELESGTEYGALAQPAVPADESYPQASLDAAVAAKAITKLGPKMPLDIEFTAADTGKKAKVAAAPRTLALATAPGLEELGVTVAGIGPGRAAAAILDGPVNSTQGAEPTPDSAVFAASPQRRAAMREKAAKLGLDPGGDVLTPDPVEDQPQTQPLAHHTAKVIDASEGTAIDPLRDHTYDLNNARTIPDLASFKDPTVIK